MFCRNCGQVISDDASNCPNCGQAISAPKQTSATAPVTGSSAFPVQQTPAPPQTEPSYRPQPAAGRKKRHGCLISLLVVLILLIGAAAAVYFFLPGLFRPFNLGVAASPEAYSSVLKKMNVTADKAPQAGSAQDYRTVYGTLVPVSVSMNSEEATSYFGYNRPSYSPWSNIQIKIGKEPALLADGSRGIVSLSSGQVSAAADTTVEVAATVDRDYVLNDLLAGQYSQAEIQDALNSIGINNLIPDRVNLYIKMSGSIQNNQVVGLKIYAASVMGIAIPENYATSSDAVSILTGIFNKILTEYQEESGAIFVSVRAADGQLLLEGQLPSSLGYQSAK